MERRHRNEKTVRNPKQAIAIGTVRKRLMRPMKDFKVTLVPDVSPGKDPLWKGEG